MGLCLHLLNALQHDNRGGALAESFPGIEDFDSVSLLLRAISDKLPSVVT